MLRNMLWVIGFFLMGWLIGASLSLSQGGKLWLAVIAGGTAIVLSLDPIIQFFAGLLGGLFTIGVILTSLVFSWGQLAIIIGGIAFMVVAILVPFAGLALLFGSIPEEDEDGYYYSPSSAS